MTPPPFSSSAGTHNPGSGARRPPGRPAARTQQPRHAPGAATNSAEGARRDRATARTAPSALATPAVAATPHRIPRSTADSSATSWAAVPAVVGVLGEASPSRGARARAARAAAASDDGRRLVLAGSPPMMLACAVALERAPAGQHLVEDRAERQEVRARRRSSCPSHLLRRHVGHRADQSRRRSLMVAVDSSAPLAAEAVVGQAARGRSPAAWRPPSSASRCPA